MSVGDRVGYTYASCSSGIHDWRCNCTIYVLNEDCQMSLVDRMNL